MSKPDWKDAPEWARWMAQGAGGDWRFFSIKPSIHAGFGIWFDPQDFYRVYISGVGRPNRMWKKTLEQRP